MMSGPAPDCMAAVMRAWMSLALMNSNTTSAPRALLASTAWRLSSTSHAGMKSTQRTMLSRVPWAKAGARPRGQDAFQAGRGGDAGGGGSGQERATADRA